MTKRLKKNSIYIKYILPMMAVLLVLCFTVFTVLYVFSSGKLRDNAVEIFNNQVTARKDYIQNEMLRNWSNLSVESENFVDLAERYAAEEGISIREAVADKTHAVKLIGALSEHLLFLLRRNHVNDVIFVLDTPFETDKKYGVYLRDRDPQTRQNSNADVLIEIAPTEVRELLAKNIGLDIPTAYEPKFDFSADNRNSEMFEKPKNLAENYPELIGTANSGYWCSDFRLHNIDQMGSRSFTYSIPLTDSEGRFFGVIGVGMTIDYFQNRFLPLTDFTSSTGNYVLTKSTGDNLFSETVAYNFSELGRKEYEESIQNYSKSEGTSILIEGVKYHIAYVSLDLYANKTPYENEIWYLAGITSESGLYGFSTYYSELVIGLSCGLFVLCFLIFTLVASLLTRPISKLTANVEKQKNEKFSKVRFDKTNIYEIDTLVTEIDSLLDNLLSVPQKMTKILEMTNLPVAAFEYVTRRNYFYCTDGLPALLGLADGVPFTGEDFSNRFPDVREKASSLNQGVVAKYIYDFSGPSRPRFIELSVVRTKDGYSGVVRDITDDNLERKKLEYERDMDVLTPLMNRKGFERRMTELFGKTTGISAMLTLDLDKLKFYNDKYGHETGDRVIMIVGDVLFRHIDENCIGCHVSGDEYALYFYDLDSYDTLYRRIDAVKADLKEIYLSLDLETRLKITVSAGFSICPRDTENLELLKNYADFALYEAKANRGSFVEFDAERYASNAERQRNKRLLEDFIEQELAEFHFQPIFDLKSGAVFGYEALIRPYAVGIDSPAGLLTLAKENNRLNDIEKITFFGAAKAYVGQGGAELPGKLFINTISTQILDEKDLFLFESAYGDILHKIVLEFTEMEFMNDTVYRQRQRKIAKWNAQCALDDYGMGYSNFSMLLDKSLHYVKIDRLLIQDVHLHPHKKEIVFSLIKYCHSENIKVIAEGIEKKEELEVMLDFGVDYAQGYFLGYPEKTFHPVTDAARAVILSRNAKK